MSSTHSHARSVDPLLLCDRWNIRISAHSRDRRRAPGNLANSSNCPLSRPPSFLLSDLWRSWSERPTNLGLFFRERGKGRSTKLPEVCSFGPIAPFRTNHERDESGRTDEGEEGTTTREGPPLFLPSFPFFHFCYLICSSRLVDPIESGRTHLSRRRERRGGKGNSIEAKRGGEERREVGPPCPTHT